LHLLAHIKLKIVIWDHVYQVDVIPFHQQFGYTPRLGLKSENRTSEPALLRLGCTYNTYNEQIATGTPMKLLWLADRVRRDQR
jgi:hypothetical protein